MPGPATVLGNGYTPTRGFRCRKSVSSLAGRVSSTGSRRAMLFADNADKRKKGAPQSNYYIATFAAERSAASLPTTLPAMPV
jgi:hypothetical protein